MHRLPFLALPFVVLAGALASPPAEAALKLPSCGTRRECGTFEVPVDRTGRVPGSLSLSITRFTAKKATKPPLFALAGGPGQAATSVEDAFADDFKAARSDRDLIVFDQRGTGSSAIDCPALQKDERDAGAQAACAKQLGAKRSFYRTPDSVEDIEAIRAALGAPAIALYGVSYGTNVAVSYALKY